VGASNEPKFLVKVIPEPTTISASQSPYKLEKWQRQTDRQHLVPEDLLMPIVHIFPAKPSGIGKRKEEEAEQNTMNTGSNSILVKLNFINIRFKNRMSTEGN
jgi:hypothetical protein